MSLREQLGGRLAAEIYQGAEGIDSVYEEILKTEGPLRGFSDLKALASLLGEDFLWSFAEKRARMGIFFYCIAEKSPLAVKARDRAEKDKRKIKFAEGIVLSTEIYIVGSKIFVLDFNDICGLIISSSAAAITQKAIWQNMWDNLQ